jgi:hypothetical protein
MISDPPLRWYRWRPTWMGSATPSTREILSCYHPRIFLVDFLAVGKTTILKVGKYGAATQQKLKKMCVRELLVYRCWNVRVSLSNMFLWRQHWGLNPSSQNCVCKNLSRNSSDSSEFPPKVNIPEHIDNLYSLYLLVQYYHCSPAIQKKCVRELAVCTDVEMFVSLSNMFLWRQRWELDPSSQNCVKIDQDPSVKIEHKLCKIRSRNLRTNCVKNIIISIIISIVFQPHTINKKQSFGIVAILLTK